MWNRGDLKTRAKSTLKKSYWKALIVSFILSFIGGSQSGSGFTGGGRNSFNNDNMNSDYNSNIFDDIVSNDFFPQVLLISISIFLSILAIFLAFRIFLGYPLEVGGKKYFVRSTDYEFNMNYLGYSFEKGIYVDTIKTMLLKGIYNFLWYLLLIIPGVIKAYSYRMVPFILGDNPNIGPKRAIKLSEDMTSGHKFNMFILDLSFIGWELLGLLLFGIGIFFVFPYINATQAELYNSLRELAISKDYTTYEELNIENIEKE